MNTDQLIAVALAVALATIAGFCAGFILAGKDEKQRRAAMARLTETVPLTVLGMDIATIAQLRAEYHKRSLDERMTPQSVKLAFNS